MAACDRCIVASDAPSGKGELAPCQQSEPQKKQWQQEEEEQEEKSDGGRREDEIPDSLDYCPWLQEQSSTLSYSSSSLLLSASSEAPAVFYFYANAIPLCATVLLMSVQKDFMTGTEFRKETEFLSFSMDNMCHCYSGMAMAGLPLESRSTLMGLFSMDEFPSVALPKLWEDYMMILVLPFLQFLRSFVKLQGVWDILNFGKLHSLCWMMYLSARNNVSIAFVYSWFPLFLLLLGAMKVPFLFLTNGELLCAPPLYDMPPLFPHYVAQEIFDLILILLRRYMIYSVNLWSLGLYYVMLDRRWCSRIKTSYWTKWTFGGEHSAQSGSVLNFSVWPTRVVFRSMAGLCSKKSVIDWCRRWW